MLWLLLGVVVIRVDSTEYIGLKKIEAQVVLAKMDSLCLLKEIDMIQDTIIYSLRGIIKAQTDSLEALRIDTSKLRRENQGLRRWLFATSLISGILLVLQVLAYR